MLARVNIKADLQECSVHSYITSEVSKSEGSNAEGPHIQIFIQLVFDENPLSRCCSIRIVLKANLVVQGEVRRNKVSTSIAIRPYYVILSREIRDITDRM